ncbi:histidine phosphatase family protein [Actinomycetospora cinnamomea]|uniref:Broad specificity phosphatase PhoE n=1 Tax=Actinomycetospora cinnamomea TaxID=663609 RepID=A0A2U1FJ34_9PSEU|nr:histidine phosphatase family protein [Actinomycetospora cinnamomea]PVZ12010.1 broad specificity phosphatase PhoE [Actinomycetospora cinnamomea]
MSRVLLIRHGETHGYFDDVGLTEHGEEQCRAKATELAGDLPTGARVAMVHAPTARATATARTLREVLAARRDDLDLGDLRPDVRFDSLQFLHGGAARESSGVAAHRLRFSANGTPAPDWVRAYDQFDTDYGAGSRLGGPIDRWMTLVGLHFEPPQVIAYRAWAGIRAQDPDMITLVASHSALLRGFAAAALGHDPGEPRNLEHVDVVVDGDHARVAFRGEHVDVEVPTELPPWLDPSYLDAEERAARPW